MAEFVFQLTLDRYVNAAMWSTKALIVKEVNNSFNQNTISQQSHAVVYLFKNIIFSVLKSLGFM